MQSFYDEPNRRQEAHHSATEGPTEPLWLEMQAPSTWPGPLHDPLFFDSSYYPNFNYHGDSPGKVSSAPDVTPSELQGTSEEASLVQGSAPNAGGAAWLSIVLGISFAGLLLAAGLLAVHSTFSTPKFNMRDDFVGRRPLTTPHSPDDRHMLDPKGVVPQPKSEKVVPEMPSVLVPISPREDAVAHLATLNGQEIGAVAREGATNTDTVEEGSERDQKAEIGGRHFYTRCQQVSAELNSNAEKQECISAAVDTKDGCNCALYRFNAIEGCLESRPSGSHISDHCYESRHIFPCSKQDQVDWQWFSDGNKCARCGFPQGSCIPPKQRGASPSLDYFRCDCVHQSDRRCDGVPPAETCSLRQLRHAYIADTQTEGDVHCPNASRRTLMNFQCPVGSNSFPSLHACRKACVPK